MKKKSILYYILIVGGIYFVLAILSMPFLVSFSSTKSNLEIILGFVLKFPFGYIKYLVDNFFLLYLILNSLFWSSLCYLVFTFFMRKSGYQHPK
jgi:hypothetical protein